MSSSNSRPPPDSFTLRSSSKQYRFNPVPSNTRDESSDRPLPSLPSSSLPESYEIPSLRRKPVPNKQATPVKHNRSLSHPFPSLFSSKRSEKKSKEDGFESSDGGSPTATDMQKPRMVTSSGSNTIPQADRDPVTGKCMTCDSTVRWPQDLKVFRCTTCLTVNDLEPYEESNTWQPGSQTRLPTPKTMPISLSKTRALVDRCLNEYLLRQLEADTTASRSNTSKFTITNSDSPFIERKDNKGNTSQNKTTSNAEHTKSQRDDSLPGYQSSAPRADHSLSVGDTQAGHARQNSRNDSDAAPSAKDPNLSIFRPVETYISTCCNGCAPMNMSFFSIKPASEVPDRKRSDDRTPDATTNSAVTPQFEAESFISEVDAKTLLLGDVVENGSWWTGRAARKDSAADGLRGKSPERWHGIVNARSPRIHWTELAEWYRLLIHAGDDWQKRWSEMRPLQDDPRLSRWEAVSQQKVQHHLRESQLHLQRALLKATENLLKRPKRPLNNPEDCRFLLMLMLNPMLSSSQRGTLLNPDGVRWHTREASNLQNTNHTSPSKRRPRDTTRSSSSGQHSGLLKRIFGLLSNLKNELHQYLVWWTSRFSDSHFQKLVDMVSSFMTYRLSRQQDRSIAAPVNPTDGLVPSFVDGGLAHASQLHAALELRPSKSSKKKNDGQPNLGVYSEDWQVRAAARLMALLFQANTGHSIRRRDTSITHEQRQRSAGLNAKHQANSHGQIIPISHFYSTMLDHLDLVADFEAWESTKTKFTFCQYPFFLSIWAKIHILEHDARRQMESRAREAFFDSILSRKAVSQYLVLKVRRDCLVEDSLRGVSETVGSGSSDIKKGLRIDFVGEEGIDAGGLRKEWFLLLVREIFDPHHGLFVYDEDSQYCYFNPNCFESSEQFFLVGILLGLAIYNSTILDVALPPFLFKKMLASAPQTNDKLTSMPRIVPNYTLEDLAEFRPALARGLRQLLDFDGDVQETFCRDFVVEIDRYGELAQIPLCSNGHKRAVTNSNRKEFVDLYIRYLLDTAVVRQYEPFKRGFFTVCGGNALSLFRPEEIELLVRGSDEPLDIQSMRAVATYDNWPKHEGSAEKQSQVIWFWESFERATPSNQRKLLGFITGSDRIPAMGATNLIIRLQMIRDKEAEEEKREPERFPIARTCFNTISLYQYWHRETLDSKLWMAVTESEGFGLK